MKEIYITADGGGYVDEYRAFTNLANAIVVRACKDYKNNLKKLNRMPDSKYHKDQNEYIKKFFYSKWFEGLTDSNPNYLLKMIEKYSLEDDDDDEEE